MNDKIGEVGVDSGMIVIVDPCLLFTRKQWDKITDAEDVPGAVLAALAKRSGVKDPAVCIHTTHGDGTFEVNRDGRNVVIEGV